MAGKVEWLTYPEGNHIATLTPQGEWLPTVLVAMTPEDEPAFCAAEGEREMYAPEMVACPVDGQGDPICLSCLVRDSVQVVSVTPQQAADLCWWNDEPTVTVSVTVTP